MREGESFEAHLNVSDAASDGSSVLLPVPFAKTNEIQTAPIRYPNRWRKGQSGNPNGRPRGSRHRATLLAENLFDGQTEELIQKAIDLALDGDTTALRLCIERIIAPRRDRPVNFRLPLLNSAEDVLLAIGAITEGCRERRADPG